MENKGLRERTIERIKTEGLFNMAFWRPTEAGSDEARYRLETAGACHTACCLAGNITLAARDLGMEVPVGARELWASQYGEEEADRLDFYAVDMERPVSGGQDLCRVTVDEVLQHLEDIRHGV